MLEKLQEDDPQISCASDSCLVKAPLGCWLTHKWILMCYLHLVRVSFSFLGHLFESDNPYVYKVMTFFTLISKCMIFCLICFINHFIFIFHWLSYIQPSTMIMASRCWLVGLNAMLRSVKQVCMFQTAGKTPSKSGHISGKRPNGKYPKCLFHSF